MQRFVTKKTFLDQLRQSCQTGLLEDNASHDVTSDLTIPKNSTVNFHISPREDIILCGVDAVKFCFDELKKSPKFKKSPLKLKILAKDGAFVKSNQIIAEGCGDSRLILAAERVILNLLQHLSGISTSTNQFVKTLNNDKIKILDTRKTFPGIRILQKYAVKIGGGSNHRFSLSDQILIKDNHIAAAGSIQDALKQAKKSSKKIELECDNLQQVAQAIEKNKPDIIMLDNMTISDIKKAITIINKKSKIEISGGINLKTIKKFSKLDIDFISVGALTHHVKSVDIGLDVV